MMTKTLFRLVCLAGLALAHASSAVLANGCGSAASQAEAQTGGTVIGSPKLVDQGGRKVCVVTVLISDPSGTRPPSRKTVTVAAN